MMLLSVTTGAGGLKKFVQSLKDCNNDKEAETKRVTKELANIRSKFSTSANLSSYQKKKYVWKLVYIFMLGHEVDFGHMEVLSLCCACLRFTFLACFLLSWRGVLPCLVLSCLVLSCRVVSCRVVSCRVVSCRALPCLALPWLCLALPPWLWLALALACLGFGLSFAAHRPRKHRAQHTLRRGPVLNTGQKCHIMSQFFHVFVCIVSYVFVFDFVEVFVLAWSCLI
jgi:hypothetical protein